MKTVRTEGERVMKRLRMSEKEGVASGGGAGGPVAGVWRRAGSAVLGAVFLGILSIPGVAGLWSSVGMAADSEHGQAAASVLAYPAAVRHWADRAFPLREWFERRHAEVRMRVLGVSPTAKVVVGRHGWLFYATPEMLSSFRRSEPISERRLERWAAAMEARRRACEARGARLVVLLVPEKHTVYPEEMPAGFEPLDRRSRMDQWVAYLREHTSVEVVDVRGEMQRAKAAEAGRGGLLYQRYDTHWTDLGAMVAYREVLAAMARARPEWAGALRPRTEGDFERQTVWVGWQDLSRMMSMGGSYVEEMVTLVPRRKPPELVQTGPYRRESTNGEVGQSTGPRLVVFHASFSERLMPMLTPHFASTRFRWLHGFDSQELGEAGTEGPEFVLIELSERNLGLEVAEDDLGGDGSASPGG